MYEISEQVQSWLTEGREVTVAQVVKTQGFAGSEPGASAAWVDDGPAVGNLPIGIEPSTLSGTGLVEVTLDMDEAIAAGLACGGTASLLVRPATGYPLELWSRLADREPVCLVTPLPDGPTEVYTPASIRGAFGYADAVPRLFGRGVTATALVEGDPDVAAVALWPVPKLVVVGDGLIAKALRDTGALLDWQCHITPELDEALGAVESSQRSDAVVVLSHDRAVDGPVLAAALNSRAGYIGALGSRRTQELRREWLTEQDVAAADQARIHGPAGLDIDAHTPAEIAISIVAEVLGTRSGASGGALRERPGSVHGGAGVHAPPPRY
jgi:xanthine dehydrogenase accessory factor